MENILSWRNMGVYSSTSYDLGHMRYESHILYSIEISIFGYLSESTQGAAPGWDGAFTIWYPTWQVFPESTPGILQMARAIGSDKNATTTATVGLRENQNKSIWSWREIKMFLISNNAYIFFIMLTFLYSAYYTVSKRFTSLPLIIDITCQTHKPGQCNHNGRNYTSLPHRFPISTWVERGSRDKVPCLRTQRGGTRTHDLWITRPEP